MDKSYRLNNDFELKLNESSTITLFIESSNINIRYELMDGDYNILVFNNADSKTNIVESGYIRNSKVNITYIELNNYEFNQDNSIDINENSSLNVNSIYLGINKKHIVFNMNNLEFNSTSTINNNVVCLNDADFELDVIGNIKKGAKESKCHQKSQCLTFESPKKAKILPVLNIDENDVEASHSLSSGTIDEEVLFYMNSRGLNKKEALGLLLVSYLMPSEEFYRNFIDGLEIKEIADKKVNKICSM